MSSTASPRAERRGLLGVPPPRRTPRTAMLRRLLPHLLQRVHGGELRIHDLGGGVHVGGSTGPDAPLRGELIVRSDDFWRRLARRGQLGLGEGFVAGDWDSPDLPTLLELLARSMGHASQHGALARWHALQRRLPARPPRNDTRRARRQIGYHYDLGNDFYELLLDPSMTYSSAIFEHPDQPLEDAQAAKYRSICEHLQLEPGMRVLEIGCGWGGFALHAAREHQVHVTGVTLSTEQRDWAVRSAREHGLDHLIDIELRDYRTLDGTYDRIASIEMLEAVGAREYPTFFRMLEQLLDPRGRACIQVIGFTEREYRRLLHVDGWLRRYIFPGGMCPSVEALMRAAAGASNLQLARLVEIGRHYIPTLQTWRSHLLEHREQAGALGFDDAFLRGWELYLSWCEAGFRCGNVRNMQLVFTPSLVDASPATWDQQIAEPHPRVLTGESQ